jgi:hypothetical protein
MDILVSEEFEQTLNSLSSSMRDNVLRKIHLLAENPAYPLTDAKDVKMILNGQGYVQFITKTMILTCLRSELKF